MKQEQKCGQQLQTDQGRDEKDPDQVHNDSRDQTEPQQGQLYEVPVHPWGRFTLHPDFATD